jgi:hypothetical protein
VVRLGAGFRPCRRTKLIFRETISCPPELCVIRLRGVYRVNVAFGAAIVDRSHRYRACRNRNISPIDERQFTIRRMMLAVAFAAVVMSHVASYYRLSRRGMREAAEYGMPGFLYVPFEEAAEHEDLLLRHYALMAFYTPLNWLDRMVLGAPGPTICDMGLSVCARGPIMNAFGVVIVLIAAIPIAWFASEFQSRRWPRLVLGSALLPATNVTRWLSVDPIGKRLVIEPAVAVNDAT